MSAASAMSEQALTFQCDGATLLGILHPGTYGATRGVLILVGGPQYRVGSHRQFVLLARQLAAGGVPVLRFDYRGMGDSSGEPRTFERVDLDIASAIDRFLAVVPGLKEVVIWGLCDAASAALLCAHRDRRVCGLVLANPWVHTEQGEAKAYLRHYYVKRLFSSAFWVKIVRGEFSVREAATGLLDILSRARGGRRLSAQEAPLSATAGGSLPDRMEEGLRRFRGPVLIVLSGNDLIAKEFRDVVAGSRGWQGLINESRVTRRELTAANHTFARREWRDQVALWTGEWIRSL